MPFGASSWSSPHKFDSRIDSRSIIRTWDCQTKGIYAIRDESDTRTLYVGMADKSNSIQGRLVEHFGGGGNSGIVDLTKNQETFTVRWAESKYPGLSEGIAIAQLSPLFNKKRELADIKDAGSVTILNEINRLGLSTPERPEALPPKVQAQADKITAWMEQYHPNKVEKAAMKNGEAPYRKLPVEQEHLSEYPTHIPQDRMKAVRDLLPESSPTLEINGDPSIDGPAPGRS